MVCMMLLVLSHCLYSSNTKAVDESIIITLNENASRTPEDIDMLSKMGDIVRDSATTMICVGLEVVFVNIIFRLCEFRKISC
ncbi:hypothetical protein D3C74_373940 [compost metagenome]